MSAFQHIWECDDIPGAYQSVELDEQIVKQDNDMAKITLLEVEKYFVERNPSEHKHTFVVEINSEGIILHICKGEVKL